MEKPYIGAWLNSLSLLSVAWTSIDALSSTTKTLPIHRQAQNGWVDFFLGDAQGGQCYRLLDSKSKVGLHYQALDLEVLAQMTCPSPEIPEWLWQHLQDLYPKCSSKYSRFSSYSLTKRDETLKFRSQP